MEQYFGIALCMVLFVGYLQAGTIRPPCNITEGGFELLKNDVLCGQGVNFTSPTQVKNLCLGTALNIFKDELNSAKTKCNDTIHERIDWTLSVFEICSPPATSPDCKWENEGPRKPFADFLGDFKVLMNQIGMVSAEKKN